MKNLLLFAVAIVAATACSKSSDPQPEKPFFLRPDAKVSIKPAPGTILKAGSTVRLSALEIVKQTNGISYQNIPVFGNQQVDCGFSPMQRDTLSTPPMLLRWATDLINVDGMGKPYLVNEFIGGENIIYFRLIDGGFDHFGKPCKIRDTIAYTPNSVMRKMEADVRAALAASDTTAAYKAFNDGMTFTPITGAEWRELKSKGLQ